MATCSVQVTDFSTYHSICLIICQSCADCSKRMKFCFECKTPILRACDVHENSVAVVPSPKGAAARATEAACMCL